MRSNGLTAPSYSPVADLNPQVAEALLTDLRERGVAAYTKPVETSSTVGFDAAEFRVAVKERLYVDASASLAVRELIASTDPASDLDNDDLAWARIVAGYDAPVAPASASWPPQEDLPPAMDSLGAPGDAPREESSDRFDDEPALPQPPGASPTFGPVEMHRSAEAFIPPEPPPLPHLAPAQQLAWVGLAGGPLLLLIAAVFAVTLPVWLSLAAVIGFVGGFLTLVAMMEDRHSDDGDSGDGAVV
jgi:hypothetical protein